MRTSPAGVRLIAEFEGCSLTLYNDPAGHCTIGYGHLVHLGRCDGRLVEAPLLPGITQSAATHLLALDLASFEKHVARLVKAPTTQHQFDALVSFAYNVGPGGLAVSSVLKMVNKRRYDAAAAELHNYVYGVGIPWPLPGLVRRRAAEAALFLTPDLTTEEDIDMPAPWVRNTNTGQSFYIVGGRLRPVKDRAHEAALLKAEYIARPEVMMTPAELETIENAS